MRIYVAGSFKEKVEVQQVQSLLMAEGHEITCDWTPKDSSHLAGIEKLHYDRENAELDLQGVAEADVVVILAHAHQGGVGRWWEAGAAAIKGTPIIIVGDVKDSVFHSLEDVYLVRDVHAAIQTLKQLAKAKARIVRM